MPSYFILVPILLPVIAGILLLVFPIEDARKRNICIEIIVVINTLLVLWLLTHRPSESFYMFSLGARLPLTLNVDGLAMFFAGLVACLWPLASLYAFEYMKHEERVNTFMAFYTITYEMCIRDIPRAVVFKSFVESLAKEKDRMDDYQLYSTIERCV